MFFTVNELAGLPGLPGTLPGIRMAMNKRAAGFPERVRKRAGTKAFEYHVDCLPDAAREVVMQRQINKVLEQQSTSDTQVATVERRRDVAKANVELEIMRKCPALLERKLGSLTDKQKQIADARMALVQEVFKLMKTLGETRKSAVEIVATRSREGTLPPAAKGAAEFANARKGKTRSGISVRALQGWVSDYQSANTPGEKLAVLAPGQPPVKPVEAYPWMANFLRWYRTPNRPSVAEAWEDFRDEWAMAHHGNELMMSQLPSLDNVRYALKKIPKAERERGRITGAEYKSLLPFVRRDWSVLPVNGVWVGDGHGIKMEVINPKTGKPFMPEITLIIEGLTRVVVGWSLARSESRIAVGDAIRHAVSQFGVPLVYYSDNGGGEKNREFDADITGIFSRLGIDHPTGIPGNPQARGIIERLNKEIPARAARKFGSFVGKSGDRETQRIYQKQKASAVNAIERGKPLNAIQKAVLQKVPTWTQLIEEIERQVQRHNNRPHSSLPVRENGEHWSPLAYRNHMIAQTGAEIVFLTRAELHEMFRPEEICTARRGEIHLYKNIYFSTELGAVEGEKVRVCYDIHDASSVIVRRMDGSWICDAIWNGNRVDAFPVPVAEQREKKSIQRSVKNLETQIERKKELLAPPLEVRPELDISRFMPAENSGRQKIHLFESEFEHEQNLKKHG